MAIAQRGNSVATVVISKWEGALDVERMQRVLSGQPVADKPAPADAPGAAAELARVG